MCVRLACASLAHEMHMVEQLLFIKLAARGRYRLFRDVEPATERRVAVERSRGAHQGCAQQLAHQAQWQLRELGGDSRAHQCAFLANDSRHRQRAAYTHACDSGDRYKAIRGGLANWVRGLA